MPRIPQCHGRSSAAPVVDFGSPSVLPSRRRETMNSMACHIPVAQRHPSSTESKSSDSRDLLGGGTVSCRPPLLAAVCSFTLLICRAETDRFSVAQQSGPALCSPSFPRPRSIRMSIEYNGAFQLVQGTSIVTHWPAHFGYDP